MYLNVVTNPKELFLYGFLNKINHINSILVCVCVCIMYMCALDIVDDRR